MGLPWQSTVLYNSNDSNTNHLVNELHLLAYVVNCYAKNIQAFEQSDRLWRFENYRFSFHRIKSEEIQLRLEC